MPGIYVCMRKADVIEPAPSCSDTGQCYRCKEDCWIDPQSEQLATLLSGGVKSIRLCSHCFEEVNEL